MPTAKQESRVYSWKEVEAAKALGKVWIVSKNNVYDVTDFIDKHPGGPKVIHMSAGQDITWLLETSHQFSRTPWKILANKQIGVIEKSDKGFIIDYVNENPFYEELCEEVRNYFKETGLDPKDPLPSLYNFLIVATIFMLGWYGVCKGFVLGAVAIGAARALLGISTMHAACHYAISHNWRVWEWVDWFTFDVMMGGSHFQWNYQHVIGHHQHTNVFEADPDLPTTKDSDFRRVYCVQDWKWIYQFQAFYLPFLYTLLGLSTRIRDILMILGKYEYNGNVKMNVQTSDRMWLAFTKCIFIYYQFYVPMFVFGLSGWEMLKLYLVMDLVTGAWLAYFFQVNHISEEMTYTDKNVTKTTREREWAIMQVQGTVEYSHDDWLFTFLSGTLNYQAVHHLFPSIAPHHYNAIAKMLKKACDKHKVQYTVYPSYWKAAWMHLKELHKKGQEHINGFHAGF
eukprot:g45242.t1